MIRIELYSKRDCHLCDEARSVLERVRKDIPFDLIEVKVAPGDHRYEEIKELIPVIYVEKEPAFHYRVEEEELRDLQAIGIAEVMIGLIVGITQNDMWKELYLTLMGIGFFSLGWLLGRWSGRSKVLRDRPRRTSI